MWMQKLMYEQLSRACKSFLGNKFPIGGIIREFLWNTAIYQKRMYLGTSKILNCTQYQPMF